MKNHETLATLCEAALVAKGYDNPANRRRLKIELKEIEVQKGTDHVWELLESHNLYPNVHNLLCYTLLGICPELKVEDDPEWEPGEFPDIDTDFIDEVRDHIKNKLAVEEFGEDFVSNIGAYGTFGLRSAFIDMAKVHGFDRHEIQAITTDLDAKDDEGKPLTFDKAIQLNEDLRAYCDNHPEVADSVKRIVNRNHNIAKHAGGLIITDPAYPIKDLVPLCRGKDGTVQTMWVEGLSGQDLQPVGLIKYDLLSLTNLKQIARIKALIKSRHGIKNLCSLDDLNRDWSNISYLNDPQGIRAANIGDMKGIFQFNEPKARKIAQGNVSRFDDLVAYSALNRPGPLGSGLDQLYIKRKKGLEQWDVHPKLASALSSTYGVLVFQEQIMKMLNIVGEVPGSDCLVALKAISKKKLEKLLPYKEKFIKNGQLTIGATEEELTAIFEQIEKFSEYAFNLSHSVAYTYITSRLLFLKAHYPLEFFCGSLMCESKTEKFKDYKLDAQRYGRNIQVKPIDINLSKDNFSIQKDDDGIEHIFYGMSNLKGIGEGVAQRIIDLQPFTGLRDFLERFGTDAKVCTTLILLDCFKQWGDRERNFKYYEFYKSNLKKMSDRDKRHAKSDGEHHLKLEKCLKEHCICYGEDSLSWGDKFYELKLGDKLSSPNFSDEYYDDIAKNNKLSECAIKDMAKLRSDYGKFKDKHKKKVVEDYIPSIDDFNPENVEIEEKWQLLLAGDMGESEKLFYGFEWIHDLEKSPDYQGQHTFEDFRNTCDQERLKAWKVEVKLIRVDVKATKGGKPFYSLKVEDSVGEEGSVTVWQDSFERFAADFQPDSLLALRLEPPKPPFPTYTLESPKRQFGYRLPPKDTDIRVTVLRRGL